MARKLTIKTVVRKGARTASASVKKSRRTLAAALKNIRKSLRIHAKKMRDADRGYKKRVREISLFGRTQVYVGVLAAEGGQAKSGRKSVGALTVAQVAAFHEFGTRRSLKTPGVFASAIQHAGIPRRSFVRGYYDEKRLSIEEAIRRMSVSVAKGERTSAQAHNLLGQAFAAGMQKRIAARIPPALADSTIQRKGSDVPLIDTGQLRSSITYRLRTKRETT